MLVYTIIEKNTGKLYDGKGDANEKCKKIQGFILFLALMFTVGSVDVKAAAPKLNKKKITIYVGHTGKLKVNNARKKVKWTSSKKQIAAVSSKGVVKGKKAGSAVITAAAGNKKWTSYCSK